MKTSSLRIWPVGLFASVLLISGCGTTTEAATPPVSSDPVMQSTQVSNSRGTSLFATRLTLPNGVVVTSTKGGAWKNITFSLAVEDPGPGTSSGPRYLNVIGNHSSVIQHSTVTLSAGHADFVSVKSTPPAASGSNTPTYKYWVIVYKSRYTYAIVGTVAALTTQNAQEMLTAAQHWTIPTQ